jgi:ribose-phosphate pyrophosphokinase
VAEVVSVVGDVKNKTCIILDDIIDTGGTALNCAEALRARGAKQVMLAGTHAIFSGDCVKNLESANLKDIVVTNSIEQNSKGVNVISLAPMIAEVIKATEEGRSIPDSWMSFY